MTSPLPLRHKVLAYVTHSDGLLVFRHRDFPEAGIQVPAGTINSGEDPEEAVLREVTEETGLDGLILDQLLGQQVRDMSPYGRAEIHHRRFYHVRCLTAPPDAWTHFERDPADGGGPIAFHFFWVRLPHDVPSLAAEQDALLPRLLQALGLEG